MTTKFGSEKSLVGRTFRAGDETRTVLAVGITEAVRDGDYRRGIMAGRLVEYDPHTPGVHSIKTGREVFLGWLATAEELADDNS